MSLSLSYTQIHTSARVHFLALLNLASVQCAYIYFQVFGWCDANVTPRSAQCSVLAATIGLSRAMCSTVFVLLCLKQEKTTTTTITQIVEACFRRQSDVRFSKFAFTIHDIMSMRLVVLMCTTRHCHLC